MSECRFPGCTDDSAAAKSYCHECLDHVLEENSDDARVDLADRAESFATDFTIDVSVGGS